MRFTCEHCGKRYSTNDVLQPDRLYRTKCKSCGNVILVKGSATAGEAVPAAAPNPTPPPTSLRPSAPPRPGAPSAVAPPPATVVMPPPVSATNTATPPASAAPPKPEPSASEPKYIDLFEGESFEDAPSPTPPPAAGARRKGAILPPPSEPASRPSSSTPPSLGQLFSSPATPAPETTPVPPSSSGPKQTKPLPYFGDVSAAPEEPRKAEPPKARPAPEATAAKQAPAKKRAFPVAVLGIVLAVLFAGLGAALVWRPWEKSASNPAGELPSPTTPARPTTPAEPPRLAEPTQPAQPTEPAQPSAQDLAKQAEQERLAKLEQEKQEKATKLEQEKAAKVEQERLAKEKIEQDRLAKLEQEKAAKAAKDAERQAKIEKEKEAKAAKDAERQARLDKEKEAKAAKDAERQARLDKEKEAKAAKDAERQAKLDKEKEAKASKAEQDRLAKAEKEKADKERTAKAEQDRLAAEKAEKDRAAKAEQDRLAKLPSGLSQDAIQATLAPVKKTLDECAKNPSRGLDKPLDARQLKVRFTVQPRGNVTTPAIDDSAANNAPIGQCLKAAVSPLVFPEFRGDPAQVEVPIALPAPAAPPALSGTEGVDVVVFTSAKSIRSGGIVGDTVYSERPQDAAITEKQFEGGVVTYSGQVGFGNGSSYAGIGLNVYMLPDLKPIDATRFKSVTFRLSSPTTRSLRLRIIGSDDKVSKAGCYPVTLVRISKDMKEYTFKFKDFDFETWCGTNGRSAPKTIPNLTGFDIADINMQGKPTQFSIGTITLNP